jgi:hypothetical protein
MLDDGQCLPPYPTIRKSESRGLEASLGKDCLHNTRLKTPILFILNIVILNQIRISLLLGKALNLS